MTKEQKQLATVKTRLTKLLAELKGQITESDLKYRPMLRLALSGVTKQVAVILKMTEYDRRYIGSTIKVIELCVQEMLAMVQEDEDNG